MKRAIPFLVLALLLGGLGRAEAGIIIVKKGGKVFIGTINPEDVKPDTITMHEPRTRKGEPPVHGVMDFKRSDVRWYDPSSDEPTDEYMKDHADEEIDHAYAHYIQDWKDRQEQDIRVEVPKFMSNRGNLSVSKLPREWKFTGGGRDVAKICWPTGWQTSEVKTEDGANSISVFTSDKKGTGDFRPRVHFFSIEAAVGQIGDQLNWIKQEAERLGTSSEAFQAKAEPAVRQLKGGKDVEWKDVEWTTTTTRGGKSIKALRAIRFRDHRTYFVTCYAHEQDFEALAPTFGELIRSLEINEAGASGAAAGAGSDKIDVAGVNVGQTYRWKSAASDDAVVWEILERSPTAVRHKATKTAPDGSKKTEEPKDEGTALGFQPIGPVDPAAVVAYAVGGPSSPQKGAAPETLTVSGQSYTCDVYETAANGKKYKLWISKKFPVLIKVTVDGALDRELVEIK
jgi:hypothetical protein